MLEEYKGLELSTQIVIKEALKRDVEVEVLDWDDNTIRLKKDSRVEYVKQATRTSAEAYIFPLLMENKEITKLILKEHGISVPESVTINNLDMALSRYTDFISKDIVIKPKSANFGDGVSIIKDLKSKKDYIRAVEEALNHDNSVLIEKFIPGNEYRFLVIGYEVVAVLNRVPANVVGDGVRSIEDLVREKNKDPMRGKGHVTPLEKIDLSPVENNHLTSQMKDINYVPSEGEVVYLRENSNISTGGDSIDFTDDMSKHYKIIALNAAKAAGAKICGVDMIIQDIEANPDEDNHGIIELNANPVLYPHDFPYKGKNRHVEEKLLDLLGF